MARSWTQWAPRRGRASPLPRQVVVAAALLGCAPADTTFSDGAQHPPQPSACPPLSSNTVPADTVPRLFEATWADIAGELEAPSHGTLTTVDGRADGVDGLSDTAAEWTGELLFSTGAY